MNIFWVDGKRLKELAAALIKLAVKFDVLQAAVVHIGGRCHACGQSPSGEEVRPVDVGRKGREGIVVSIQCRKN